MENLQTSSSLGALSANFFLAWLAALPLFLLAAAALTVLVLMTVSHPGLLAPTPDMTDGMDGEENEELHEDFETVPAPAMKKKSRAEKSSIHDINSLF